MSGANRMTAISEGPFTDIPHARDQALCGCGFVYFQPFHCWVKSDRDNNMIVRVFR
jgi:hypothetical protein